METSVELKEYFDALFDAERRRVDDLRAADQRAIQIKEQGDRDALVLAREIQQYKDEKNNSLREQLEKERGEYATRVDLKATTEQVLLKLAPLETDMLFRQGKSQGYGMSTKVVVGAISLVGTVLGIIVLLANHTFG